MALRDILAGVWLKHGLSRPGHGTDRLWITRVRLWKPSGYHAPAISGFHALNHRAITP